MVKPLRRLAPMHGRELKKGSAELLILALVEVRARHGYEIGKLIEQRSDGAISFSAAALYPLLYRLEKRGWLHGRWVEKPGERRRRYYSLTPAGRVVLGQQRSTWRAFAAAIDRIAGTGEA
ncbi:MAG TPA: PadR family transcriptional regulator [Vicinamibacterales bacterium]|nr:PadR family transcriptional regulator [Vicinamibacterales bacterium]